MTQKENTNNVFNQIFRDVEKALLMAPTSQTPNKKISGNLNDGSIYGLKIKSNNGAFRAPRKSEGVQKLEASFKNVLHNPEFRKMTNITFDLKQQNTDNEPVIRTFVRIRPLLSDEEHINYDVSENILSFPYTTEPLQKFAFNQIFLESSSQSSIFNDIAMPMLKQFVKGFDCLMFAHGVSKTGKTHTLLGNEQDPGIIPRVVKTLLAFPSGSGVKRGLFVSCVEIYNERIHDLFGDTSKPLRLSKDGFGYTDVKDATEQEITQPGDFTSFLNTINDNRRVFAAGSNTGVQNSHCVFIFKLLTIPIDPSTGLETHNLSKITSSRFTMVDLAPCERVSTDTENSNTVSEISNTNKSIMVLGKCLREIHRSYMGDSNVQVPFRETKLTELFRDFFDPISGRTTYCAFIVNISPSTKHFYDSLYSLQFAIDIFKPSKEDDVDEQPSQDENQSISKNIQSVQDSLSKRNERVHDSMRRMRMEINEEINKIQNDYQRQLEQIRSQSAQPYTSKLQQALARKAQNESAQKELADARQDLNKTNSKIEELEGEIKRLRDENQNYTTELESLTQQLNETVAKNERLSGAIQQMIEGTKQLQQKQTELEQQFEDDKKKMCEYYENKIKELEAKLNV